MERGPTDAPPPTPCSSAVVPPRDDAADALSRLLLRLPPNLMSLPTRRSAAAPTRPPVISLDAQASAPSQSLLSASTEVGYFQLIDHRVPSGLARSAESGALSLFQLTEEQREAWFPRSWPLGYEAGGENGAASFCLDSDCTAMTTELELGSLRDFSRALERVGLELVEVLAKVLGLESRTQLCSLMWVCQGDDRPGDETLDSDRFYPYLIGLQYQTAKRKLSLLSDSGWASVSPRVDSLLVILGDIAQVWSNGKVKKVRGRPVACWEEEGDGASRRVTMTLLLTLPMDSVVSPQPPLADKGVDDDDEQEKAQEGQGHGAKMEFEPFSFKDYAWTACHERFLFKDPLDKHRIRS